MKKLLTFLMLGLSLFAFSCKNVSDSDTGSSQTGGGGSEQKLLIKKKYTSLCLEAIKIKMNTGK